MASLRVLAFDHEGRPIQFDTWLDDLQLYLLGDSRDSVSLFDHNSDVAPAPPVTPDSLTFYHPTSRRLLPSQDVTFDESVPFYILFPYSSAPPPPPPLFLALGHPPVDPLPPQGPAPSSVSQVDPLPSTVPVVVAFGSDAIPGAASGGAASGGAEPGGAESEGAGSRGAEPAGVETGGAEPEGVQPGGAEPEGVEPGGAEPEGAESGGAEPRGTASSGGPAGALPRLSPRPEPLSPQELREWFALRTRLRRGAAGAGDSAAGGTGAGGAGVTAGASGTRGAPAAGPGGARTKGTGAAKTGSVGGVRAGGAEARDLAELGGAGAGGTRAGGAGAGGAGAIDHGLGGAGGTVRPRPNFVPLLQQPTSRRASPVRTCRRVPRSRPPPVPGTHAIALRPSSVPLRVPLLPPPESSLSAVPDPESDRARAASPIVSRLLATAVTDPSFESTAASALVAELVDFAVACPLDYATALVAESESAGPSSVGGECALGTDILEDRQEDFECLSATIPRFASMLLAPEVKWQPGSPPAFKACYVARGFSEPQGVDYIQNFSPTPKMTTLWVLLHVGAQRDYELHSLDFSTGFLQGSLQEEFWLCRPPCFTGTTLAALGFTPSTTDSSLFLRTDTSLPPFYVLVYVDVLVFATADTQALTLVKSELQKRHTCTDLAPPSDESVEPSGPFPELVGCLMYLMTYTRPDLAYPLSLLARYVAPDRHQKVHWDAAKRVLRYLCSTSGMGLVLGGRGPVVLTGHADASWVDDSATQRSPSCEAEIYARAMAAHELRWLTYLLTDLGEQPRSPPLLYVDNKAMIALFREHILEHRTKHFALRYFLAQELQQHG
ncbi:unnamed protein product [Closterium sp. NIES-53]